MDWQQHTLLVPVSKSGRPRAVALNAAAVALLQSLPRKPGNQYIFPSRFTGRPCASLFYPWDRIRRRADLTDVRLHDLRHSFASFLVNQGASLYVVQDLLGHTRPDLRRDWLVACGRRWPFDSVPDAPLAHPCNQASRQIQHRHPTRHIEQFRPS